MFLVVVLALALGYAIYQNYYNKSGMTAQKDGFWPGWRRGPGWWPGWRGRWRGRGWGPGYWGYNYPYGYYPYYYY